MKHWVRPESEAVLQRDYPIKGTLPGWFFRCREVSMGVYKMEGADLWGHTVSRTGTDPDALMAECEAEAKFSPPPGG
jgi:hypothetical protein